MPELKIVVSSQLHYRKMGSGPVLALLHGFPADGTIWSKVWTELSRSFTLLIPDFPGSGGSSLEQDTSMRMMADAVIAILDAEGVATAVVAGHSMGGYVAFELAAHYAHRLAGLSLVHSIPVADDDEKKNARLKSIELIRNGGKDAFIRQLASNLFATTYKQQNQPVVEALANTWLEVDNRSLINFYTAMMERNDNRMSLDHATFAVQWIIGLDDNVISYKKILEQCHTSPVNFVTFYENCGHMSMLESPARFVNDLKEFTRYCFDLA